ncbi:MAG: DNA translocase FtsK [Bacteroidales bacterium]|nr:DNA translocase FtsK [Bacteroidales bacterium]
MKLLKTWDEDEKASAIKILGLLVGAFTLFILISTTSYLFTWQADMSLLESPSSDSAHNAAGKLGIKTGHLLVCRLFGLGSYALLLILGALTVRLLSGKWKQSLLKTTLIALFGAFIASLILAYISKLASLGYIFGGGLGGRLGAYVIDWWSDLVGMGVTAATLVVLLALLLLFSSKAFSHWLAGLGKGGKKKKVKEVKEERLEESVEEEEEPESVEEPEETIGDIEQAAEEIEEKAVVAEQVSVQSPEPQVTEKKETEVQEEGAAPESFEVISDDSLDAEIKELKPIDNRLDPPDGLPKFSFPPSLDLLLSHSSGRHEVSGEELTRNNNKIRAALANYRIQINDVKAQVGPTVTLYKVYPAPGVKIADIKKLQEDIGMSLNAKGVRVTTLPDAVGIEVANDYASIVPLKQLLNDPAFRNSKALLPVAIGYTITQKVKVFDLTEAPHLLIAGATQQGKSVGLNVIVSSLLYSKHPSELKFVFIDPKMVEFSSYASLLYHYLAVLPDAGDESEEMAGAIAKSAKAAEKVLRSLCVEMDQRYELLSKAGVNKLTLYNEKFKQRHLSPEKGHRFLPYLVVVVDEYADLTMMTGSSPEAKAASRSITNSIIRLAQKGRAAGLHVILATQRPSVDVISGIIKSNFPMRIAFRVASKTDSMTILGSPGAEKLIGRGDMIFSAGIESERIQCALITGDETEAICNSISAQKGYQKSYNTPYYLPEVGEAGSDGSASGEKGSIDMGNLDDNFEEAAKLVVTTQKGSTSDLQRKLGMGYARSGKVMDQLEAAGIVGPQEGSKPRQVLVSDLNSLQSILDAFMKR